MRSRPCYDIGVMSPVAIVFTIIGALALAAGIFVLLYFVVFMNARLRKMSHELTSTFERSHAILFGEITQYIRRLETISSMNLSYVDDYRNWNKRYRDVCDVSDSSAQTTVNLINDMISERKYRNLKAELPNFRLEIEDYEKRVDGLDRSLKQKFVEEEETKHIVLETRAHYRSLKQTYFGRQADLALMSPSFETMFHRIEELFGLVDSNIENAQYADAKRILDAQITPVVDALTNVIVRLPDTCVAIQSLLPDKLISLNDRYDTMVRQGYPLGQIVTKSRLNELDAEIKELMAKARAFETSDLDRRIAEIDAEMTDYFNRLNSEQEARKIFESEHDSVYALESTATSRFIHLNHSLPSIKKIYLLNSEDQNIVDEIQKSINLAGATKRSLDTYEHNATRQPYGVLVEKMHQLRDQSKESIDKIDEFRKQLIGLKNDTEEASKSLPVYANSLHIIETNLRNIGIEELTGRYQEAIEQIYGYIDELNAHLSKMPIDARAVRDSYRTLKETADALFEMVDKEEKNLRDAETAIVRGNRNRSLSTNNDEYLRQAETLLFQGDFLQSAEMAKAVKNTMVEASNS